MEKMNPEVKAEWIAALRSGNYVQGQKALHNTDNTYCCLGVLCDLYLKQSGNGIWQDTNLRFYNFIVDGVRSSAFLPEAVKKWAGLNNGSPEIPSQGKRLDILNDNGVSFADIANMIENEL